MISQPLYGSREGAIYARTSSTANQFRLLLDRLRIHTAQLRTDDVKIRWRSSK